MSQPEYRFVPYVELPVGDTKVTLHAGIGNAMTPFVYHVPSGTLHLPVKPGMGFSLHVTNYTPYVIATPARIGDGEQWTNIYRECPVTDPALMPSTGGMWEIRQNQYGRPGEQTIDGFALPNSIKEPFLISPIDEDGGEETSKLNIIEVYYRAPAQATVIQGETPFATRGSQSRGASPVSSDVTVVAGEGEEGKRIITGIGYEAKATLIGAVHLASRRKISEALRLSTDHLMVNPVNDESWGTRLRNAFPELYGDLTVTII